MSGAYGSSHWLYDAEPFEQGQSLKFDDGESQRLTRTPTSAGNRRTFTFSCWVKRGLTSSGDHILYSAGDNAQNRFQIWIDSSDRLAVYQNTSNSDQIYVYTTAKFRDSSAWYNICAVIDTTDGTAGNRIVLYVNGTSFAYTSTTTPTQNLDTHMNNTVAHAIGGSSYSAVSLLDGYLADVHFIDGQALDPTSFIKTENNQLKPKEYFGTYGTNGFRLNFQDDVISEGFNAVTYEGTNSTTAHYISGIGFAPNLVWIKNRDASADHALYDSLRTNLISSNSTAAEVSSSGVVAINSDGFGIGSADSRVNSAASFVAWCWEAGGTPTATNSAGAGATPTAGSVKIDGSNLASALAGSIAAEKLTANTTKGFSIGIFTKGSGTETVAHGLGAAPNFFMVKRYTGGTGSWYVYHSGNTANPETDYLRLNSNDGTTDNDTVWGDTAPTSTVFSVAAAFNSSEKLLFYAWTEISGYSKFGSFTGNGGSQEITVGFRPALVVLKRSTNASNWHVFDATRNGNNPRTFALNWDRDADEATNANMQFSDTGFNDNGYVSDNGETILYMAWADTREAAFFKDVSGNNNHFSPTNLDYRDSMIDTPSSNFAVLNSLDTDNGSPTFTEGNLKASWGTSPAGAVRSTYGVSSGKWYAEFLINGTGTREVVGVLSDQATLDNYIGHDAFGWSYFSVNGDKYNNGSNATYGATYTTGDIIGVALDMDNGTVTFYKNGASQGQAYSGLSGTFFIGISDSNASIACSGTANYGQDSSFSGAQIPQGNGADGEDFFYAPPTGFKSLQLSNLPTPAIADPTTQFNTAIYSGDGNTTQSVDIATMNPDFVWIKSRSSGSGHHSLVDRVRGDVALNSNQATVTEYGVGAFNFNSDNTIDVPYYANDYSMNTASSTTYAAWNWVAGGATPSQAYTVKVVSDSGNKYRFDDFGTSAITLDLQEGGTYTFDQSDSSNSGHPLRFSTTSDGTHGSGSEYTTGVTTNGTAGSAGAYTRITVASGAPTLYYYCSVHSGMGGQANTNSTFGSTNVKGTIQSTVSANTTSGFSISTYTGSSNTTFGHGLSSAPEMVWIKSRDSSASWGVWHTGLTSTSYYLFLDSDAQEGNYGSAFINPSNDVVTIDASSSILNSNSATYLAYCFHSVLSFSKIGSYVGNQSTDGVFVHLGFRPIFVLLKEAGNTRNWVISYDHSTYYNGLTHSLFPNITQAEDAYSGSESGGGGRIDFLSNGFKVRTTSTSWNNSGGNFIYLAFAAAPFKTTSAR